MKKNYEGRKHNFKRQSSQESKRFKGKKGQNVSPFQKEIYLNTHTNKENCHPNLKLQSTYQKSKLNYYELKNQSLERELAKNKHFVPIPPTQKPKEIQMVVSKSLEKCQFYHKKQTPKSSYLIQNHNDQFLCCEDCSKKYQNKTNLKKLTQAQIGGKRVSQYFRQLEDSLARLQTMKENTQKYKLKYKDYAYREEKKYQKYYHEILQIIEESMRTTENTLKKKTNEVQIVFDQKIANFQTQIGKVKKMLNTLLNVGDEFYDYRQLCQLCSGSQDINMNVPFISLSINEDLIKEFKAKFSSKYALKVVTEKEPEEKPKKNTFDDYYHNSSDYYTKKQIFQSKNHKLQISSSSHEDTSLYCDEALGPSVSTVNNFSFQEQENKNGIVPIIELTEEEDIISPAFKDL